MCALAPSPRCAFHQWGRRTGPNASLPVSAVPDRSHPLDLDCELHALAPERRHQGRHTRRGGHAGFQEFRDGVRVVGRQLAKPPPIRRSDLDVALLACVRSGVAPAMQGEAGADSQPSERCWVLAQFTRADQVCRTGQVHTASPGFRKDGAASGPPCVRRASLIGLAAGGSPCGRPWQRVCRHLCQVTGILLQRTFLPLAPAKRPFRPPVPPPRFGGRNRFRLRSHRNHSGSPSGVHIAGPIASRHSVRILTDKPRCYPPGNLPQRLESRTMGKYFRVRGAGRPAADTKLPAAPVRSAEPVVDGAPCVRRHARMDRVRVDTDGGRETPMSDPLSAAGIGGAGGYGDPTSPRRAVASLRMA